MGDAAARVEKLVWVGIYGGMILLALGIAVGRTDAALGWGIGGVGVAALVAGLVLVWVRSRMRAGPPR
jgi:hypothetical protein